MMPARAALVLLTAFALAGCGGGGGQPSTSAPQAAAGAECLLPAQHTLAVTDLYFGRDVPGRGPVSDYEWAGFVARQIAPRFPDGFTVTDATGQWLSPTSQRVVREATKVVRIVAAPSADLANRLQSLIDAYRTRFRQESVGVVTNLSCAAF